MMSEDDYNYDSVMTSLDRALDVLGESPKRMLLFYMASNYGISPETGKRFSLKEIEFALNKLLGKGCTIITDRMHSELQKLPK